MSEKECHERGTFIKICEYLVVKQEDTDRAKKLCPSSQQFRFLTAEEPCRNDAGTVLDQSDDENYLCLRSPNNRRR